jgi:hypothetical protein
VIERGDFVEFAVPHGYNEDGGFAPFAQSLQHDQAIHVGKHLVKKNDCGLAADGLGQRLFASRGFNHVVAITLEAAAHQPADLHFVIDDQHHGLGANFGHAHGWVLPLRPGFFWGDGAWLSI